MAVSLISNNTTPEAWKMLEETFGTINKTDNFVPTTLTNPFVG
jgi:hypothetical protein